MKKKVGKYIVYIDSDYIEYLSNRMGISNQEDIDKFMMDMLGEIHSFLKGEKEIMMYSPVYTNDKGLRVKGIEISPILSPGNPKTLNYIRKLNKKR